MEFELVFRCIIWGSMFLLIMLFYSGLLFTLISLINDVMADIKLRDKTIFAKALLSFIILIFILAVALPCWFVCKIAFGGV